MITDHNPLVIEAVLAVLAQHGYVQTSGNEWYFKAWRTGCREREYVRIFYDGRRLKLEKVVRTLPDELGVEWVVRPLGIEELKGLEARRRQR